MFWIHVCLCITCVPAATRGLHQVSQKLQLQMVVSPYPMWVLGTEHSSFARTQLLTMSCHFSLIKVFLCACFSSNIYININNVSKTAGKHIQSAAWTNGKSFHSRKTENIQSAIHVYCCQITIAGFLQEQCSRFLVEERQSPTLNLSSREHTWLHPIPGWREIWSLGIAIGLSSSSSSSMLLARLDIWRTHNSIIY